MLRDEGIPYEAGDLERYLNTDNIIAHYTWKGIIQQRGCIMERGRRDYYKNNEVSQKA